MLFAKVGVGQIIYNGTSQAPGYTTPCFGGTLSFQFTGTGSYNSSSPPIYVGDYTLTVGSTACPTLFTSVDFSIIKATPTLSVTNSPLTYTANAQGATLSSSVAGSPPSNIKYNGFPTLPINAGTYTLTADFAPTDASNYNSLIGAIAGNFTISKAPITISNIVLTKIYDGTPTVNVISTSSGTISADSIVVEGSATNFSDKIVGNNYSSTVTFILKTIPFTGKENNYYISGSNPFLITNGSITKLPITLTASANTKVYDGTVSATATPTITTGALVSGDVGTFSEIYNTKTQGTNKILTPTVVSILDAANTSMAGNYSITYATNTSGVITKLPITLTASTNTKVYDGTLSATATPTITLGTLASGDVGVYSETYDTKNQGTNKTLTPTATILDASNASMTGNYNITYATNTSGVITKLPITLTASANTKVYDGTVSAIATPTLTGTLAIGDVGVYSETYDTKNQGTNKTLTPSATILDATSASVIGNYSITYATNTSGVITKLPITLTASTNTKEYDGTLSSTASPTLTGALASGDVGVYSETYDTKNQGTNKILTPSATILDATSASVIGNYSITYATNTSGVITKLPITLTASTNTKEYDGTLSSTASPTLTGALASGDVGLYSETYDTKSQGINKTLTPTGTILDASNALMTGNYSITYASVNTGVITKLPITLTATANTKVYDGTLSATATSTITLGSLASGDVGVYSETYDTKNQGTSKVLTPTATILDATNASMTGNYSITYLPNTNGVINTRSITITASVLDKQYDGNANATVTLTDNKISGDDLTVSKTGAAFNNKNIGTGKIVTVSGISLIGTDAGNYTLTSATATGTASITVKSLTISATVSDKVYDGNTNATATLTSNSVSGDDLTVSKTGSTFNNKNIGTGKTVTVSGISLTGTDAGNYTLTSATATGTASITVKSLTISATASNKEYDGNLNAAVVFSDNRISSDVLTINKTGVTFNNKNVGVGKIITISGISLTGTDAGNYSLTNTIASGTANITAKNLTVSAIAKNKPYDGNKLAEVTLSDNKINSDLLTSSYTLAEFESPAPADNKLVTVSGISIAGVDAGNYSLTNNTATAFANITGTTKAYDLPNAFTPNGDGKNDEFKIIVNNHSRVTLVSFQIYNRNGILMFSTNKISEGWDGRYKGVMQDMGIYFVKLITLEKGMDNPTIYLLK
jgi:gliding motility-associated-like protein